MDHFEDEYIMPLVRERTKWLTKRDWDRVYFSCLPEASKGICDICEEQAEKRYDCRIVSTIGYLSHTKECEDCSISFKRFGKKVFKTEKRKYELLAMFGYDEGLILKTERIREELKSVDINTFEPFKFLEKYQGFITSEDLVLLLDEKKREFDDTIDKSIYTMKCNAATLLLNDFFEGNSDVFLEISTGWMLSNTTVAEIKRKDSICRPVYVEVMKINVTHMTRDEGFARRIRFCEHPGSGFAISLTDFEPKHHQKIISLLMDYLC